MPQNNQYLIISQSGRALAASAKRAEIDVHVIDLFADEDTVVNSLSNYSATGFSGGNNSEALIEIVDQYIKHHPDLSIVIGSGFEDNLELLAELEQRFTLIANHSSTVRQIKDPVIFFDRLEKLSLPFPEYFTDRPSAPKSILLQKTIGGAGGGHISLDKKKVALTSSYYLQAYIEGRNYSATFLADGKSFYFLGFNETWVCDKKSDFTFAGAVSNVSLPNKLSEEVTDAIRQLVLSFNLHGLCSLDFIVEDETGQYLILEVNPRPTATFELYENQRGLFVQHLAAFDGLMTKPELSQGQSRALGVLYAEESITMPLLEWPDWVTDRPKPGKKITKGEPVCTIHAEGSTKNNSKEQLMMRLASQGKSLELTSEVA
ncbi:MAG: putative ATP-grasp superfamily ATP-dependent carboligase [Gammaproteobacteria bacterium]|jgi:predicted ATP-grasp superfamily ATP-dependent carboligase